MHKPNTSVVNSFGVTLLACVLSVIMIFFTRASHLSEDSMLNIMLPDAVEDFKYAPTLNGYQYRLSLYDGRRHQEIGYITDPSSPEASMFIKASEERRQRPKSRPDKKRKLAAGALKALGG